MKSMSLYIIIFFSSLLLISGAEAKEKDLTAPLLTCGVIGQLVQDAAISLGPIYQAEDHLAAVLPGPAAASNKANPGYSSRSVQTGVRNNTSVKQPKAQPQAHQTKSDLVFEPQAYHFSGEQMWGKADVTLVTAARGFDVKVKCTLPVKMWALFADDSQIASDSVPNLTSFTFKVGEIYTPPYKLILNVIYQGLPNQIRVELSK